VASSTICVLCCELTLLLSQHGVWCWISCDVSQHGQLYCKCVCHVASVQLTAVHVFAKKW
jgi:hypothetical protein